MEVYGAASAYADAEVMCAAHSIFDRLGVQDVHLEVNSIGCPKCRPNYTAALREYFGQHRVELCDTCRSRLERNPMRILDCKSPVCSKIAANAPKVLDYLCEDCEKHFEEVKSCLNAAHIRYRVNPAIVRGLDYYTRTVFEFVTPDIGTICGGGRYDGLIEEIGGQSTPSLGFGMGMERLLLLLDKQKIDIPAPPVCDLFVIGLGDNAKQKAFSLIEGVRNASLMAEGDIVGRTLKAQMKYANKIHARFCIVIGDSEIEENTATLKNMETKEEKKVPLDEGFFNAFYTAYVESNNSQLLKQLDFMKSN